MATLAIVFLSGDATGATRNSGTRTIYPHECLFVDHRKALFRCWKFISLVIDPVSIRSALPRLRRLFQNKVLPNGFHFTPSVHTESDGG